MSIIEVLNKDVKERTDAEWAHIAWHIFGYYLGGSNNHTHVAQSLKEIGRILCDVENPKIEVSINKEQA